MSDIKCNVCDREFKSNSGLKIHSKSCKAVEEPKIVEEVVEDEVVSKVELSDNIVRRVKKLKDLYSSTWDAEARYKIQLEIKELEG